MNAAGALTYTTLFAVVPLMTVTYTFFSLICLGLVSVATIVPTMLIHQLMFWTFEQ